MDQIKANAYIDRQGFYITKLDNNHALYNKNSKKNY
jgi:hypothetical protein